MLIYSKQNGKTTCTCIIKGASKSNVSHSDYVWDKHKNQVDKLSDNGDVFVTGGTYKGAIYEGKFEPREMFSHYLKDLL